ncbi:MAG: sugar transferase, partial [Prevotella sp.]|nr:sugar transferase [Prevotella sp.]
MEQVITMVLPKYNDEKGDMRFIEDGMNEVERNIKRIGDFVIAAISLVVFSPL